MGVSVRIGIIGDFNPDYRSHVATNASLAHASESLGIEVQADWLATPALVSANAERVLTSYDGLWAASGSPYGSMEGALTGIRFARVRNRPFVGT